MPKRHFQPQLTTKNFVAGATVPWSSAQTVDLLTYTDYTALLNFFLAHKIDHLRFPGGTQGVPYLYNDNFKNGYWLTDETTGILNAYYTDRLFADITPDQRLPGGASAWLAYLKLCQSAAVKPIIAINTLFYTNSNTVYPIEELRNGPYADFGIADFTLDSTRWTNPRKIQKYVQDQVKQAHASYTLGDIIWELGNENSSYYNADTYSSIVIKMIPFIKDLYPNDKVCVSLTRGMLRGEGADSFNTNLIAALNTAGVLTSVDYFVVHYYPTKVSDYAGLKYFDAGELVQADIDTRIEDTWFKSDLMTSLDAYFSGYSPYEPKYTMTEFLILESDTLANSQLHALFMLDALMKARSEEKIKSISKQTFSLIKNGIAFQAKAQINLARTDAIIGVQADSLPFPYVTPQGKAQSLFSDAIGNQYYSYSLNSGGNGLAILVTKTNAEGFIHVLNYKDAEVGAFDSSAYDTNGTFTQWIFPNLASSVWDEAANKSTGITGATTLLPAHSLTVFRVPVL